MAKEKRWNQSLSVQPVWLELSEGTYWKDVDVSQTVVNPADFGYNEQRWT